MVACATLSLRRAHEFRQISTLAKREGSAGNEIAEASDVTQIELHPAMLLVRSPAGFVSNFPERNETGRLHILS
jgi:hypothetical protein